MFRRQTFPNFLLDPLLDVVTEFLVGFLSTRARRNSDRSRSGRI